MSELTNIHARAVKDLTTPTNPPADPNALDQVKLVAGNFPAEYAGNEALTVGMLKELAAEGREEELDALILRIENEEIRAKEVEAALIKDKANKATTISGYGITDAYTQEQIDSKVNNLESKKANKVDVDTAFSNLSTNANKYYSTLAAANSDIANIALNQSVTIGEEANAGLWYKATAEATSLTKSPYDPLTQAKADATAKADAAEVNAKNYAKPVVDVYVKLNFAGYAAAWVSPDPENSEILNVAGGIKDDGTLHFNEQILTKLTATIASLQSLSVVNQINGRTLSQITDVISGYVSNTFDEEMKACVCIKEY